MPLADLRRPRGEDGKTRGRDSLGCRLLDLRTAEDSALLWVNTRRKGWGVEEQQARPELGHKIQAESLEERRMSEQGKKESKTWKR